MKKLIVISIILLVAIAFSCKDKVTPTFTLQVTLTLPGGFTLATIPDGTEVKLISKETGRETVVVTTGGTGTTLRYLPKEAMTQVPVLPLKSALTNMSLTEL